MFARELDRRSREAGWGIRSNAAHPGATVTNLQVTGPTRGGSKARGARTLNAVTRRIPGFWQQVDTGILPALHAATSPDALGGGYYGPSGYGELTGAPAPASILAAALREDDAHRLWAVSERLTGVGIAV